MMSPFEPVEKFTSSALERPHRTDEREEWPRLRIHLRDEIDRWHRDALAERLVAGVVKVCWWATLFVAGYCACNLVCRGILRL
jgi:hypothetical protein